MTDDRINIIAYPPALCLTYDNDDNVIDNGIRDVYDIFEVARYYSKMYRIEHNEPEYQYDEPTESYINELCNMLFNLHI